MIVNALYPPRFDEERGRRSSPGALTRTSLAGPRRARRRAVRARARADPARAAATGCSEGLGIELVELPYLFAEQIGRPELELLADALDAGLATPASVAVTS